MTRGYVGWAQSPFYSKPIGPTTTPEKFAELMRLWRLDLKRSNYGQIPLPNRFTTEYESFDGPQDG